MNNKPKLIYHQEYTKPVRSMMEYTLNIDVYSDQSVQRYLTNTIFQDPSFYIDGMPLLNVYGQWIYNSLTQVKDDLPEEEEEQNI